LQSATSIYLELISISYVQIWLLACVIYRIINI